MSANFNDAAVNAVLNSVISYAMASGRFDSTNGHEPKNAPGNGLTCAVWVQSLSPFPAGSGLSATTGVLGLSVRIYTSFTSQPFDAIDPSILSAVTDFMGELSEDFDFGNEASVRTVDLLGMSGSTLSANAGYIEIDRHIYRIMTLSVPIIINDMFIQTA